MFFQVLNIHSIPRMLFVILANASEALKVLHVR